MRTRNGNGELEQPISMTVVRRIPTYLNVTRLLREEGVEWVSSEELARACGVAPSSVRTDLGNLGKLGMTRHGYSVATLLQALEDVLGIDRSFNLVIVGAGNMGQAIANHQNFRRRGFHLKGIFDNNPAVVGQEIAGHIVQPMSNLVKVVKREQVDLGAVCVPAESAQAVADQLVKAGVVGIWNFAPAQLLVPPEVILEDVHLSASLLALGYRVKELTDRPGAAPPHRPREVPKTSLQRLYGKRAKV
jgi:redox-sensing transcriptional repressor